MTNDCIFCKIRDGEIPSDKVYEDDNFIVIQDIKQVTPGHMLLIPKEHSMDILEMNTELGKNYLEVIQKMGRAMMKGLGATGFNIGVNTKESAGQVVFHTHTHLIPRYSREELHHWKGKQVTPEESAILTQKLISALD